ncbi:MAG: type II and III secretion system protein family protein [Alphaproteobacteria bacterium]|nr:type II and III secretion system protein family protein [Alphaproteobacteria bacterium]
MPKRSVKKRSLVAALSAAVAFAPSPGLAQQTDAQITRITHGGAGATAASVVLPFGKSAIVDLPADARDVLLSNPQIADAVVRTSRRVYIIGRAMGQTNAFFFDAAGRQIANIEIRVEPDVEPLNEFLRRHAPNMRVTAEALNGSIVLSGTAHSASEADRAVQMAESFLGTAGGTGAGGGSSLGGPNSSGSTSSGGSRPRIINLIQVEGSEQVLVRVRVVEMSRTLVRQLGINLNYEEMLNRFLPDDTFVNVATQNGYSINGRLLGGLSATGGIAETVLNPASVTFPGPNAGQIPSAQSGVGGYAYDNNGTIDPLDDTVTNGPGRLDTRSQIDASIEAFERAGLLRVLAEPNLTAISGEPARFLAGGEFPVPVAADDGEITIQFKPFGVGLAFTPVVLSGGRISLKLSTEVSELTSEGAIATGDTPIRNPDGTTTVIRGITIPGLQVRRAETTLEMPSGGAIVLAGLIQERTRHALEGLPGAMNVPVLGQLFRSRDFINNETELVIIVTPYLVQPTAPENLRTPADGFMNPSESESLLTGRLNAMYRPGRSDEDEHRLVGPHGHVVQ